MSIENELLQLDGEKLSLLLGKVLNEVKVCMDCAFFNIDYGANRCKNPKSDQYDNKIDYFGKICEHKAGDPIPINDPKTVAVWWTWARNKFMVHELGEAMMEVYYASEHNNLLSFSDWLLSKTEGKDYLQAIAICENESKNN